MESGGGGAVMLPLFRERGRHARTTPPGPPRSTSHHYHPPSPPRDSRPLAVNPLSTPRNVNSRRFNSYEYFPRAWGRSRSGGKDTGEDEEAEEGEEEADEETGGRVVQERGKTLKTRLVLLRYPSDDSRTFSRTVFALAFTFRFLWILSLEDSFRLLLTRPTNLFLGFDGV